ncbi:MAG: hypothetical protein AAGD12_06860 [Pseudomonadota bacterium]
MGRTLQGLDAGKRIPRRVAPAGMQAQEIGAHAVFRDGKARRVEPGTALQSIGTGAADQDVVVLAAGQRIVARIAAQGVAARPTEESIIAKPAPSKSLPISP